MKRLFVAAAVVCAAFNASAQDAAFAQYYSSPVQLNPAMVGTTGAGRFASVFRDQWGGLYKTYQVSYDQFMSKIKGGLGLNVVFDKADAIATKRFELDYAYRLKLSDKGYMHLSASAAYQGKSIDWDKLGGKPVGETVKSSLGYPDFSAGLVGYWQKFNFGFSAGHLSQPNESFIDNSTSKLNILYNAHFSTQFGRQPDESGKGYCFGAEGRFLSQGKFNSIEASANGLLWRIMFGFGVKGNWGDDLSTAAVENTYHNDALAFRVGFRKGRYHFSYNFDLYGDKSLKNQLAHEAVTNIDLFKKKKPEDFLSLKPMAF